MNENKGNSAGTEGQASFKSNLLSVLSPLLFVIIVIVLMIIFGE